MIRARIMEPNLDFQPLLIEEVGDNIEDEEPSGERESEHGDWLGQEDEVPGDEIPNEDVPNKEMTYAPKEPPNPESEEL